MAHLYFCERQLIASYPFLLFIEGGYVPLKFGTTPSLGNHQTMVPFFPSPLPFPTQPKPRSPLYHAILFQTIDIYLSIFVVCHRHSYHTFIWEIVSLVLVWFLLYDMQSPCETVALLLFSKKIKCASFFIIYSKRLFVHFQNQNKRLGWVKRKNDTTSLFLLHTNEKSSNFQIIREFYSPTWSQSTWQEWVSMNNYLELNIEKWTYAIY